MPRRNLVRSTETIYHVTNRSNNKDWFYIPIPEVWKIATETLALCSERYGVVFYAFALMSNHFHLMLSTPNNNLDAMMRFFQTEVARAIQHRSGRINHIFGGRYKWSCLWNSAAVAYVYKYILRNPVRAGLTDNVESYPYSSLFPHSIRTGPWTSGITSLWQFVPKESHPKLAWLNQPTPKEIENLVSKGLRRYEFKFSQGNSYTKRLRILEKTYGIPTAPATFPAVK